MRKFDEVKHVYKEIPTKLLKIDHSYQRDLMPIKVEKIVKNYNPLSIGVLSVNVRPSGEIFVLDGQHRLEAMRRVGVDTAPCKVYTGLSEKEEAEAFIGFNVNRANPKAVNQFKARVKAEEPIALEILKIVKGHGHTINYQGHTEKGIVAVNSLDRIYLQGGKEALDQVFEIINKVYLGEKDALQGIVLQGIHRFIRAYRAEDIFDKNRLIHRLKQTPVLNLISKARGYAKMIGGDMFTNIARAMLEIYNYKLVTKRLPDKLNSSTDDTVGDLQGGTLKQ